MSMQVYNKRWMDIPSILQNKNSHIYLILSISTLNPNKIILRYIEKLYTGEKEKRGKRQENQKGLVDVD